MYLSKGFCLKFSLKICNFSSVLAEWDIFSHDFLSQNYSCELSRGYIVRNSIWYTSVKLISINDLLGVFVSCLFKDILLIAWYIVVM